jgi:hypothetical protein
LRLVHLYHTAKWALKISDRFIQQAKHFEEDEIICYLSVLLMLSDGRWPGPSTRKTCMGTSPLFIGSALPYNGFFLIEVPQFKNYNIKLAFSVGVERVPNLATKKYEYNQYIKAWAVPDNNDKSGLELENIVKTFT